MQESEIQKEVIQTLIDLKKLLDRMLLRGLRAVDEEDRLLLGQAKQLFLEHGAGYLVNCIGELLESVETGNNAVSFLQMQTALFLFERLFTQSICLQEFPIQGNPCS